MNAIETIWKGYRFRSRTEARWAVFFDAIKLKWNYEHEGFHLKDGSLYLPDFYFPAWNYYAEVKGADFTKDEETKCAMLSEVIDDKVILLDGPPEEKCYKVFMSGEECSSMLFTGRDCKFWPFYWGYDLDPEYSQVADAIEISRGARFEHGETPV